MGKMRQTGFLCVIQILHQTARRDQAVRKFLEAKTDQRRDMEMLLQAFAAQIFIKIVRIEGINRDMQPVSQIFDIHTAHQKRVVADDFRRVIFVDFIQQLFGVLHLGHIIVPGCDIRDGQPCFSGKIGNAHQIIVFGFLQRLNV